MRAISILVEPFKFINYLKLESIKELNNHGQLIIKGIIKSENVEEYQAIALKETWINISTIDENDNTKIFFYGILTSFEIEYENKVHILTCVIKTGSFLLDIIPHIRSFQDKTHTYSYAINSCLEKERGKCIMLDSQEQQLERFFLQYKETDWEFIKRLAGYLGKAVIPEFIVPGKKFYVGYKHTSNKEEIITDTYQIVQDYEDYEIRKWSSKEEISITDMISYEISTREIFELGQTVLFKGMEMIVGKMVSNWTGGELCHVYSLYTKKRGKQLYKENKKLRGTSLKANIKAVDKTKVQIQIQVDENIEKAGEKWFDFATVYSSPDGTGWYCMPEIGDEVRVNFPNTDEEAAYVASCVHLNASGNRINPDEKSWKNKQEKEILFTPESLILRNNKGNSIELSDSEGVKIISNKKIILQAANDIDMHSQSGGAQISAADSVLLNQGSALIRIDDEINISGGKIYMN